MEDTEKMIFFFKKKRSCAITEAYGRLNSQKIFLLESLSPVQGWKLHAGEAADFLLEYWKAGADELSLSGGRRTVELQKF